MASSNSYNFTVTRDQLITDALLHIGAIGEGETPSANAITEAARLLNMMVKLRAAIGMPAWALKRGTILPVTGVSSVTSISHIVTTYDHTILSAAEAALQTVLSVTSSTGMTAADQVGIELANGTMHWTTIVSVDSAVQITITTAIPTAASSGAHIYAYTASTDRIQRPLRIIEANVLKVTDNESWSIEVTDRSTYYSSGNRAITGTPNTIYYEGSLGTDVADPSTATTWYGTVFISPRFTGGANVIEFTYHRPFQDFDATGDSPDFPQEFYLPLMLELAALSGPRYGVAIDERKSLFVEAKMYLEEALSTVYPEGSLKIQPDDNGE